MERFGPHRARQVAIASMAAIEAGDREAWLALFAPDAHVEDPVGASPLDPTGEGHRGLEAIASFYDTVISTAQVRFAIRESYAAGDECANVGTITSTFPDGGRSIVDGVYTYRLVSGTDDRLRAIRAFWEFDGLRYEAPTP